MNKKQIQEALARKLAQDALKPQCNKCGGKIVYYRLKSKSFVCRTCGNEWKKNAK